MNNLGSHHSSAMPSDVRASAYRPDSGLTARDQNGGPQAAPRCLVLLGGSERGGRDEAPEIEGKIPRELRGSLYRNGPGLFDRGGLRKPHLLLQAPHLACPYIPIAPGSVAPTINVGADIKSP